jgi:hypothetical protein
VANSYIRPTRLSSNVLDKRVGRTSEWATFRVFSDIFYLILYYNQPTQWIQIRLKAGLSLPSRLLKMTPLLRRDGQPSRRDIQPKNRKLTDYEERAIVQYILHLDSKGFPPRLSSVKDIANHLLSKRSTERVG